LPGESAGMLRKPERWIASSIGSVAMGHELSTTTVQLAQACSVVANGGMLMKPRLVMRKGDQPVPPASGQRVLTGHNSAKMRAMMRKVVDEGTGKLARLKGYTAGGKTGSAQIYDYAARVYTHRYNGSFMGFAPVSDPAIVIVVTLNNTPSGSRGFGGVVAAPVFQKVATAALRVLGVPKDAPEEVDMPPGKPIPESDLADAEFGEPAELEQPANGQVVLASTGQPQPLENVVYTGPRTPDFGGKTKRTVLAESIELGIRVETEGAGIARRQYPAPGTPLQVGTRVRVKFSR
jgi:cell division protein FtsI (penicillin-binding protein 3)